jgi:hypothetical protein
MFFIILFAVNVNFLFSQYSNFNSYDCDGETFFLYKKYFIKTSSGIEELPKYTILKDMVLIRGIPIHYNRFNPYSYGRALPDDFFQGSDGNGYFFKNRFNISILKNTEDEVIIEYSPINEINYGAMSYDVIDIHKFNVRYYNTSNEYILQLFNRNFIKCLSELVTIGTIGRYNHFSEIINHMDKEELAKFRNLLFALHNYKFTQNKWIDFFKEYYNNYNGILNEEDAFAEFTEREKIILTMILQKERN